MNSFAAKRSRAHDIFHVFFRNGDGLCIDASLCEGRTAHCETFNNEPLCSSPYFSISVLEMITFDFSTS